MQNEFSSSENVNIGVYTWNMGGAKVYDHIDMREWLLAGLKKAAEMPDILVIGIQEMVPLKSSRLFSNNRKEIDWVKDTVMKNLYNYASKEQFQLVREVDMFGLIILLVAKKRV